MADALISRRTFLKTGLAGGLLLGLGGCGNAGKDERRTILSAIAAVILDGALPVDAGQRKAGIERTVDNIEATIAGLPPATQAELDQLFGLLASGIGRTLLAGVWSPWATASPQAIAAFLESWRHSRFDLLRSAYAGLHDLTLGAWYAEPDTWAAIGYPGPPQLRSR